MGNIDHGFNVDILSLSDTTLISSGTFDPSIVGFNAPPGSIFLYNNLSQGEILLKVGELDTEWSKLDPSVIGDLPAGGNPGEYLVKNSTIDYDFVFTDRAHASVLKCYAKNNNASTLLKGTPVYQVGSVGTVLIVDAADASNPAKMPAVGVLGQDLAPAAEGELLILGEILGVNTSAFNHGDLVYVAEGGGYTNIKPTASTTAIQFLGIVTKVHATNGGGVITGTGTNDLFKFDGTSFFFGWNGTSWNKIANDADVVHKAGDSMTGSLSLPKTKGQALLVDNTYAWIDIIGDVSPKSLGSSAAQLKPFVNDVNSWTHSSGSYGELVYHVPHDYAPGTDAFIHIHWGHNGTNISGNFVVDFYVSIAKRQYPATSFIPEKHITLSVSGLNITNSPQYCHRVDEVQLSIAGGTASLIDTNLIETDGIILIHYVVNTIPSITGSTVANLPYIQTIDLHVQSTNIGTKNKDPNFWS